MAKETKNLDVLAGVWTKCPPAAIRLQNTTQYSMRVAFGETTPTVHGEIVQITEFVDIPTTDTLWVKTRYDGTLAIVEG